jgi:glycosyltransferase involved in cell wall biosynthesis
MAHDSRRIALVANSGWYLYNFRQNLICELRQAGYAVIAVSPADEYARRLMSNGTLHRHVPLEGGSTNPVRALRTVLALRRVLGDERVDVALSFTPKGNIYTGLAAMGLRVRQLANISGLGSAFVDRTPLTALVSLLYRFTLGRASWVFFQNEDDKKAFVGNRWVDAKRAERIPGSGVDLARFTPEPLPCASERPGVTFLLNARMLWDKGVGQFVEAARVVRKERSDARFQLLGPLDLDHPSAVSRNDVDVWVREGTVEYLGVTDDVRPYVRAADCVVLPSFYREGVPRSLLEAAAMARPVITTDTAGCRDIVDCGVTGYLCGARDAHDLSAKIKKFLDLPIETRAAMGNRARQKVEGEFDERFVVARYLAVLAQMAKEYETAGRVQAVPFTASKRP